MVIPPGIMTVSPPPLHELHARARELALAGAHVVSLGQGVPMFAPAAVVEQAIREAFKGDIMHRYSQDEGLQELRYQLAQKLSSHNSIEADPDNEIIVTCGANQAFMTAVLTVTEPGDHILLPAPYFVNHEMAVRICGRVPVEVPLSENDGFQIGLDALLPYVSTRTKALVMVSPNNPTGAVYDKERLIECASFMASRGIFTIADETYEFFVHDGALHFSIASVPHLRQHVITLGSFSKTFAMTGWRLGYLVANSEICTQAIKVHNAMMICAPVPAQIAILAVLKEYRAIVASNLATLQQSRAYVRKRLSGIPLLSWHPTNGAFFAFVRVDLDESVDALAMDILETVRLVVVPGTTFGQYGEGYLRLSYALDTESLGNALDRLEEYFSDRQPKHEAVKPK
jgi:aminotransferase